METNDGFQLEFDEQSLNLLLFILRMPANVLIATLVIDMWVDLPLNPLLATVLAVVGLIGVGLEVFVAFIVNPDSVPEWLIKFSLIVLALTATATPLIFILDLLLKVCS